MAKWEAHLVEMRTGRVGAQLGLLAGGSWRQVVNGTDEAELVVSRARLLRTPFDRRAPWRAGVLLTVDDQPLICGPIIRRPTWTDTTARLSVRGIRAWMAQGFARDATTLDAEVVGDPAQLIMQWSARLGGLPIVDGHQPFGTSAAVHGWDMANANLDAMLTGLTDIGPDLVILPEWVDPEVRDRVRWRVLNGSTRHPLVPMGRRPVVLDATAPRTSLAGKPVMREDWQPVTRVYVLGAGQGAAQLIAQVDNQELLAAGWPILEATVAATSTETLPELEAIGRALLAEHAAPIRQWETVVDARRVPVGSWRAGDLVQLDPGATEPDVPTGRRDTVCLSRSGAIAGAIYTAELQEV